MDKSGQIPLIPGSEEGSNRWSVHPGFVIAIAVLMLFVAAAVIFHLF
jgi:hypothetical protein